MRRSILILAGAATVAFAGALPANAAQTADTIVTFTLAGGTLDITAPAGPIDLGSFPVNSASVSGLIGPVEVIDSRGADPAAWVASVASTDFTSGTHTIPAASASYAAGTLTTTGDPTFAAPPVASLSTTPQPVVTATAGSGNNSATWNPTLTVTLPGVGAVAGAYTATITHSVA